VSRRAPRRRAGRGRGDRVRVRAPRADRAKPAGPKDPAGRAARAGRLRDEGAAQRRAGRPLSRRPWAGIGPLAVFFFLTNFSDFVIRYLLQKISLNF